MNKIINIVVDTSGSMAEDDKNAVVKYFLNGIVNILKTSEFDNIDFILYQWGEESKKIESLQNAKLEFKGKASITGIEILQQYIDRNQSVIFVSDGNLSKQEKVGIRDLSVNILPIFVGIDANKAILKEIATKNLVYSIPDFMQCVYDASR
jgi:hypothetical protein